ncbi:hypothetical protein [Jiulongibacter sp. NS-SX5]|uniref:hypothetical protein n=1 Tax=Jiulongibacter sp. NS-SX5 TaxID=3463854 RepID=UPI0040594AF8
MKKLIIAALVGGLILFVWQFVSWAAINFHADTQQYTPKQEEILEYLDQNLEEGFYFLPTIPPGGDEAELMENSLGKPWAQIYYHKEFTNNMTASMSRGLIIDILAAGLMAWLLLKMGNPSFQTIIISCIAVGLIGYFTIPYLNSIWFETPTLAYLLDAVGSWGLTGLWLGWWLRR